MRILATLSLLFLIPLVADPQGQARSQKKISRKVNMPGTDKPECAQGAICFSGEVREGEQFRKVLNADLEFVIHIPGGFDVVSRRSESSCKLSLWIANPPLMAHHDTEIDAGYDWTAEMEIETSPRKFRFLQSCREFQSLYDLVYDPSKADAEKYFATLEILAKGQGRLWITDARVRHSRNSVVAAKGAIEWMKFSVEIKIPAAN